MKYEVYAKAPTRNRWKWCAQGSLEFCLEVAETRLNQGDRVKIKPMKPEFHRN